MSTNEDSWQNGSNLGDRFLLCELGDYKHAVIFHIAAGSEKVINDILGHGKSRGCLLRTLCFINRLYLLIFTCEEGNLFPLNGRLLND